MSITFMHHFHPKASAVKHIGPGVQDFALTIHDGLVEVEAVQVESHGGYTKGSEPDTDDRPGCQEEVKASGVIEAGILEDETTEVAVGCNDVVGLFFLTKLITVVLRLGLSGLSNKGAGNQRPVHG